MTRKANLDQYEQNAVLMLQDAGWETALETLWPTLFVHEFADFHKRFWEWGDQVMPRTPTKDFISIWFRGAGKSSSTEALCAYWGIMRRRRYIWYVCATQQAADDHITAIGELLQSEAVERYFPTIASRKVDRYGNPQGWRRNRLITEDGFAIDALGLDVAARGRKIGNQRPDAIIFDDLDETTDTIELTEKKIDSIAKKIILAGTPYTAIVGVQNLIIPTGIFASFADGTNKILKDAIVDGPIPAVYDLQTNAEEIVGGTPSWEAGMPIDACQNIINQTGLHAFLLESQHDVHQTPGALWAREHIQYRQLPDKVDDYCIGIDPAMSDGPRADFTGIFVAALADGIIYIVEDRSGKYKPERVEEIALELHEKYRCQVHIEIDNGGEWLPSSLKKAGIPKGSIKPEKSGGVSKIGRATPLSLLYKIKNKDGVITPKVFHCDKFTILENQMVSWVPSRTSKSPDHIDAMVWATSKWVNPKPRAPRGYG